jgi:osmotically-inducible protein OsmY
MKLTESKNLTALAVSIVALFALGAAGCSDRTQQAASNTVESAGQDAQNHAQAAGEAVEGAGREIKQETKEAAQETAVAADKAGDAIAQGASNAAEAVGGAVKGAAKETQDAGQVLTITPKVKNALVSSKDIDASTIDVDTSGEKDTVVLKGSVRSAKEKQLAEQIAKKTLADNKSSFKVVNQLTVGASKM